MKSIAYLDMPAAFIGGILAYFDNISSRMVFLSFP
jgi:hypothetical protein